MPRPPRSRSPRPAGRRPRAADLGGSRERLFHAATREFAARGFAGASVDRVAAAARLNKAMIYYHFRSKAELYREILRDMFTAVAARVDTASAEPLPPDEKIRRFVEAIASEAEARPHFPPIWFREIAEGGQHVDESILRVIGGIVKRLAGIIDEGVRANRFVRVDPFVVHGSIVGPVLLYFASASLRKRMAKSGLAGVTAVERDAIVEHVQRVALATLEGRL